ncbi:MAG TPA: transporter [Verrucomicrobiae bacterium]|nr:transporter [Verrucomicrobiae bacterium]
MKVNLDYGGRAKGVSPLRSATAVHIAMLLFAGDASAADKSPYNLFNPTPRELMREMSTDRPDKTESAYTLDAGHYQIEMDVFSYAVDRYNGIPGDHRSEALAIAPINLKAGLLNNVDLQFILQPYISLREHNVAARVVDEHRGFGDVITRLKVNVWGNDGGPTALALMPYVKLPTNTDRVGNNSAEGGLIVPFAVALPQELTLGVMTQVDIARDESGGGHHPEFVNTITVGREIVGDLSGFLEFFSSVSTESGSEWIGTFDAGLTYMLTDDVQLDAGVFIGLTRAADDINPFLGMSWRF